MVINMVGFVGAQARRRRRNRYLFILLIIIIFIFIFYLPTLDFTTNEQELPDEILPDTVDDQSSLISEIEELKLEVFQKDQRIKFRDNQINDLKKEKKELNNVIIELKQSLASIEIEYDKTLGNFSELENNISENSSENINKIEILQKQIQELNNQIKNYKDEISNLNNVIANSISSAEFQDINIENSILKGEIKAIKQKSLEVKDIIDQLETRLEEKQKQIDELLYLKDLTHHG
tara:strand:+ start:264 stop:968 length:705 start_codon:yes stop_codon:yes gene_type:complete